MASGKLRLAMRPMRLVDEIREAIESVRPILALHDLRIEHVLDEKIGIVCADPKRIQQIAGHLLTSAAEFTPDGGRIEIAARRLGKDVEIRLSNTGIGISRELPHVFERIDQAESSTTRERSGPEFGLAIAKQLVELHDGTISGSNEVAGRGATFTVRLPLPRLAEHLDIASEAGALAGVSILLVEDDPATQDGTRRLLELDGAIVRVAKDAAEARAAYVSQPPELILCDIGLPAEDGLSLIRSLRELERDSHRNRVPAVAATAFARLDDERLIKGWL